MALEDFFTLTEMKDGLMAIDRVEELVRAMQKEKDAAVHNIGETARQWSTVANTLVVTENMSIRKHFIQLGGLLILDQWLQTAQQYSNNTSDSSLEESTCELFRALEKLPIDHEMATFSGIIVSVKNLIEHKSLRVQERAKALFDWLNRGTEKECNSLDVGKDGGCVEEVKLCNAIVTVASSSVERSAVNISRPEVGAVENKHVIEISGNELQHPSSPDFPQSESVAIVEISLPKKQTSIHTTSSQVDKDDVFKRDAQGSSMSTPSQLSRDTVEESCTHLVGGTNSVGTCCSPVTAESNGKTSTADVIGLKDISNEWSGTKSSETNADENVVKETFHISSASGPDRVSSDNTHAQQSVTEHAVINDVDGKESKLCPGKSFPTGVDSNTSTVVSNPSDVAVGIGLPEHSRSQTNFKTADQNDGIHSNVSQDLSVTGCIMRESEDVKTHFPGKANDVKELALDSVIKVGGSENSATTGDISKPTLDMEASDVAAKSRLDRELDFVDDDALEVARQVAQEVEREVVDYREPLYSSSSKQNSESREVQPGSPDSVNGEQDQPMAELQNGMPAEQQLTGAVISPKEEDHLIDVKNMGKSEDCECNHNLSQVTEAAQEPVHEKIVRGFDLNEESYSQEMDQPSVIVSSSIVAASTKIESELELHGAPTSILKINDAEKVVSVEGSSSSKQRQDFLDIDLNVAEGNNEGAAEPILPNIRASPGFPSGESSVEVSSKRAKKLDLDLNHTVYDGYRSPSPVSSSSLKQSGMRNLDLNDNPSLYESHGHPSDRGASSSQGRIDYGGLQVEGPSISLFGAKLPLPIKREETKPPTSPYLAAGREAVSSNINVAQPSGVLAEQYAVAYLPPPQGYRYNNLRMEPFMSLTSAMYGSAPATYSTDSRETPMERQIMGSSMALPPSYPRSLFPMSTASAPSGYNWAVPSQLHPAAGPALYMAEGDNRERAPPMQLFNPGQTSMLEEQMASSSQSMSSAARLKRGEPDSGFDPYMGVYRRQPPSWQ